MRGCEPLADDWRDGEVFSPVRGHPARGVRRRLRTRARRRQVESPPQHSPGAGSPTPRVVRRSLRCRVRTPPAQTRQTFRPPPSASRDKPRRWKPSPSARGARDPPREPSPASPWDPGRRYARVHDAYALERAPSAARPRPRRARARAAPRRQLFVRLRAPLSRSSGSSPPLPAQAPSESTSKRLSSEDVIKYTKDFIVQLREVRRTARRVTLTARTSLRPRDRRPSGLWSRADAAASLSFPETRRGSGFSRRTRERATPPRGASEERAKKTLHARPTRCLLFRALTN